MQSLQDPDATAKSPPPSSGGGTLPIVLALAAVLFGLVSLRPLTHSEVRYVEAGAEMVSKGDWVVPHLAHVPYFEKPIFTYWAEAIAQVLFGVGRIAVRLPSILAALAMVATTWGLARTMRGGMFGLGAAALLAGGVYFEGMSSVMTTDPLFAAWLVLAWYAFRRHDLAPRSPWIWLFWAAAGMAVLTKGPLGAALLAVSIAGYLALCGRIADLARMRIVRGAAVVLAVNLPWWVLVWRRDPRYVEFFLVRENLQAFTSGEVNHPGPPWYYLPYLVGATFPSLVTGTWALVASTRQGLRRVEPARNSGLLYAASMFVPPLLLLSVAGSKLGTYVLPLMPAAALLSANWIADRLRDPPPILRWGPVAQAALLVAAFAAAPVLVTKSPAVEEDVWENAGVLLPAALVVVSGAIAAGVLSLARRIVPSMAVATLTTVAGMIVALPAIEDFTSETDAGELMPRLLDLRTPQERVIVASGAASDYSIVRAIGERTYVWGAAREIGMGHFTEATSSDVPLPLGRDVGPYDVGGPKLPVPQNPWLLDDVALAALWRGGARVWLVARRSGDLERLRALRLAVRVIAKNDTRLLATNQPVPAAAH